MSDLPPDGSCKRRKMEQDDSGARMGEDVASSPGRVDGHLAPKVVQVDAFDETGVVIVTTAGKTEEQVSAEQRRGIEVLSIVTHFVNERRKPFESNEELCTAVDAYLESTTANGLWVTWIYGYPIGRWDVAKVKKFNNIFNAKNRNRKAEDFNEDIGSWDLSQGTDFTGMFFGASKFNADLSKWNVSAAKKMSMMFSFASSFTGNIGNWNVSKVTTMDAMFVRATLFNCDLSKWDVSNVICMVDMFASAESFQGDVSSWDVSNVVSMGSLFYGAKAFNCDLSAWNVSNVNDMRNMFNGALPFQGSDLSGWNVSHVRDMSYMFRLASAFESDLDGWDVSHVTTMCKMFEGASRMEGRLPRWYDPV